MQATSFTLDSSDLVVTVAQDADGTYTIAAGVQSEDSADTALTGLTSKEMLRLSRTISNMVREQRTASNTDNEESWIW